MDIDEFRKHGHQLIDWMADYMDTVEKLPVHQIAMSQRLAAHWLARCRALGSAGATTSRTEIFFRAGKGRRISTNAGESAAISATST